MNFDGIAKYLVLLSFLAIWAITSLMNRETKPVPARRPMPRGGGGPRPGDPTLRFGSTPANATAPPLRDPRRSSVGREDDILIISNDDAQTLRQARVPRPGQMQQPGTRRTARVKPNAARTPKPEPSSPYHPLVADLNQGVSQHLATSLDKSSLTSAADSPILTGQPIDSPANGAGMVSPTKLAAMMADPARLREAFLMNELLMPPVAHRRRGAIRS